MIISRIEYQRFLTTEIEKQKKEYEQTANTNALVLKNRGEVFVARYLTMQASGMAVFKVRNSDLMPRKNSFWTATIFNGQMASFKNWGDNSWIELCQSYQNIYSDAHCAWIAKSDDPNFCLVGVKNLTIDFADKLEEGHYGDYKCIGEDLFELRCKFGSGYRIYYTEEENIIIIFLK